MNADAQAVSPGTLSAAPAGLPDGHRIGSFELQSVWQRSGTAVVYRAWDHALVRPVALKEYLPAAWALRGANGDVRAIGPGTAAAFERGRQGFIDEARTLARCDHPSLMRVLELLELRGTAYRVMPWYSGLSLLDVRRKMAGPFGEPALRALLDKLLGALHAYQRAGGVHRGVSPAQVMLLDEDQVLLLGPGAAGGAALAGDAGAPARGLEGAYAPPEQTHPNGQPQGPWTDFYALAGLARFCITGLPPPPAVDGATPEPLTATIETLFPGQPAVRYADELLRELDAAMAPDVSLRPQTAAQFRARVLGAPHVPAARAADSFHAVDPAMQDVIRHVIDSIDAPLELTPAASWPDAALLHADPSDRGGLPRPRRKTRPGRTRALLQGGAALAVVAALGFGTLDFTGAHWPPMAMLRVPVLYPSEAAAPPAQAVAAALPPSGPTAVLPVLPVLLAAAPSPPPVAAPVPPVAVPLPVVAPALPAAKPIAVASTPATGPRQECGARSEFSLYRCMQQQCGLSKWRRHLQCVQFEATDSVD
jgi:serine/threonine protein kinase